MDRLGIRTVREFADRLGISRDTFYSWTRNNRTPDIENLLRLSRLTGTPLHELVYMVEPTAPGAALTLPGGVPAVRQLPINIAGDAGSGPQRLYPGERIVYVEESFARGRDLAAFQIVGNSMEGGKQPIYDGDLVLVNQFDKSLSVSAVVARIDDDGYVCKRPVINPSTGKLTYLKSANLEYDEPETAVIPASRVSEIVGRVVRVIHNMQDTDQAQHFGRASD